MKEIILSRGAVALVDDEDFEKLNATKWHLTSHGYATKYTKGNKYKYMHREILCAAKNTIVDHIDGNKLNNTKSNLRFVTAQQNSWNIHSAQGKVPLRGVYDSSAWAKKQGWILNKPYAARITKNGKSTWLGRYLTKEEANSAYLKAKESLHVF